MNKHNERAELIRELKELAEALPFEGGRYMDYAAELVTKAAAMLEAQRPALKPLTDGEKRGLFTAAYEKRLVDYESYLQGIEDGEAAHGIKDTP